MHVEQAELRVTKLFAGLALINWNAIELRSASACLVWCGAAVCLSLCN